jgi:hypothetical protein
MVSPLSDWPPLRQPLTAVVYTTKGGRLSPRTHPRHLTREIHWKIPRLRLLPVTGRRRVRDPRHTPVCNETPQLHAATGCYTVG